MLELIHLECKVPGEPPCTCLEPCHAGLLDILLIQPVLRYGQFGGALAMVTRDLCYTELVIDMPSASSYIDSRNLLAFSNECFGESNQDEFCRRLQSSTICHKLIIRSC